MDCLRACKLSISWACAHQSAQLAVSYYLDLSWLLALLSDN